MSKVILLAGRSGAGKTTLARALCRPGARRMLSTSDLLRELTGLTDERELFDRGNRLDKDATYPWIAKAVAESKYPLVVDAIRSDAQERQFWGMDVIRVNVVADHFEVTRRQDIRNRPMARPELPWLFSNAEFTWQSDRVSVNAAIGVINQLAGFGGVDLIVGGQYGSEGKGKLAAHLAGDYDLLVRTGGPNAGHWVRDEHYEYCFHHLPSGTMANRRADIAIAAGATLGPGFWQEVQETEAAHRLFLDPQAFVITDADRKLETDHLVSKIGSTAQGVGAAAARRAGRGIVGPATLAEHDEHLGKFTQRSPVALEIAKRLGQGQNVMVEGTQGSGLSLYHGPYPFTTSRDTNVGGLLAEVGIAPAVVRDTWMVLRTFPIRVGGNSGPMVDELTWEEMATRTGQDLLLLKSKELTSTTKRQRRIGEFDYGQFRQAVTLNRPNKLFITFADYLDPAAAGVTEWGKLPDDVHRFVNLLERTEGVVVHGISTGRRQFETCWR